jgi:hypothetical protein
MGGKFWKCYHRLSIINRRINSMKCEFCGSNIETGVDKCSRCGAAVGKDAPIPPPSPYYKEVLPPEPVLPKAPEVPIVPDMPPTPALPQGIPASVTDIPKLVKDPGIYAIIAFVIGLAGVLFSFLMFGCFVPFDILGIYLAKLGMKSEQKKLARAAMILNVIAIIISVLVWLFLGGVLLWSIKQGN